MSCKITLSLVFNGNCCEFNGEFHYCQVNNFILFVGAESHFKVVVISDKFQDTKLIEVRLDSCGHRVVRITLCPWYSDKSVTMGHKCSNLIA